MARKKKISDILTGATSGAAAGATVGSAAGPWGTAIGGGLGAVFGGIAGGMSDPRDNLTPEEIEGLRLKNMLTEEQIRDMQDERRRRNQVNLARGKVSSSLGAYFAGAKLGRGMPISQRTVP